MNKFLLTSAGLLLTLSLGIAGCSSQKTQTETSDALWSQPGQGPTGMLRVVTLTEQGQVTMLGQTYDSLDPFKEALGKHVEQYPQASTVVRITQGQEQSPQAQELISTIREAGDHQVYQAIVQAEVEAPAPSEN